MKKKLTALFFGLIFCIVMATPAMAEAAPPPRLVDGADLLTDAEESDLLAQLDEISERQWFDVVIVTADTLDGQTPRDYADDFYDYNGYGYGENNDGALLLLSMEDRDGWISTTGYGITVITDAGREYIIGQVLSELSDGNYAAGFAEYAELCDAFITQADTGDPYDSHNLPSEPLSLIWIPIALVVGVIIAAIGTGIMKGKLKSVRKQAAAADYLRAGSFNLTQSRDVFLYSTITKRAKPKESSGSSTHRGSSGTSHGGGGFKF